MLTALRELGIVVIDLFPYALNPRHTPFGYRDLNQKKKLKLAIESGTFHLRPKILACRERGAATVRRGNSGYR